MKSILALLLAALSIVSLSAPGGQSAGQAQSRYLLSAPQYPEMAPFPKAGPLGGYGADLPGGENPYEAWRSDRQRQLNQMEGYADALDGYLRAVIPALMTGRAGENKACSPINIYMALAMLAELTDGESRRQILSVLGSPDLPALRAEASAVWNANYCDDGAVASILASSLWLNEDVAFRQETLDALAKHYYAASFRGKMGTAGFNRALQAWLSEQTGGLLKEQASGLEMQPETILALAATIYFRAKWSGEFSDSRTGPGIFHAAGGDVTRDFMRRSETNVLYRSGRFSAVAKGLEGSGAMWFLLPEEGVTPEALLADRDTLDFLLDGGQEAESRYLTVNLSVPKFDIVSDMELSAGLRTLGIRDVFDADASDFSPLTDQRQDIFLSRVQHAARAAIDEDGVTAAAYTVMMMDATSMPPPERVDFTLDRPFVFAITGADGLPLFVGVVHDP